jgi:rhodanese-related sulfurtransferase
MPTSIGRDELQRLIAEQNRQLVEVLPAAEYEEEHLGAINVPLNRFLCLYARAWDESPRRSSPMR